MLAAVLLSVLGVSDDDIAADYALSRAAMRELAEWVRAERPESYETMAAQPPAFLDAPPLAMRRFLARARSEYGSLTDYVRGAGLTGQAVDAMRSTLLGVAARAPVTRQAVVGGHRLPRTRSGAALRPRRRACRPWPPGWRDRRPPAPGRPSPPRRAARSSCEAAARCRAPLRCSGRAAHRCGCRSSGRWNSPSKMSGLSPVSSVFSFSFSIFFRSERSEVTNAIDFRSSESSLQRTS